MKKYIMIIILLVVVLGSVIVGLSYRNYTLNNEIKTLQKYYKNSLYNYENKYMDKENDLIKADKEYKHKFKKQREGTYSIEKLEELDLEGINKIMISTHPDDEMFWGGGHLLEDDYLVVCVTCGMDSNRQAEFEKTMKETGEKYVMLTYPRSVDPSLNREFNWNAAGYLTQDLENIINLKDWDMIVTHNPKGEYGHKYHILTSQVVTSVVKDKDKLYYFGKFYNTNELDKLSNDTLKEEIYNKKVQIINDNYKSQWGSVKINSHMFKNENFIKYADWK